MSGFAQRGSKHPRLQGLEVVDCFSYMCFPKCRAESASIQSALDLKVCAFSHWNKCVVCTGNKKVRAEEIELEKQVAEQKGCIDRISKSTTNSWLHPDYPLLDCPNFQPSPRICRICKQVWVLYRNEETETCWNSWQIPGLRDLTQELREVEPQSHILLTRPSSHLVYPGTAPVKAGVSQRRVSFPE